MLDCARSAAPLATLLCLALTCLSHTVPADGRQLQRHQVDEINAIPSGDASAPAATIEGTATTMDLMEQLSWQCANNATCLYGLSNGMLQAYRRGETIKLGPLELTQLPASTNGTQRGRGISSIVNFFAGNAIRIPIGPMVFRVQRAEDDADYIEVALLKKSSSQARRGGGLLGGGGGGGGGGGRLRRKGHDKKQFQMLIPMYLAATTFGWTLVAAKAVGMLTLKALLISKLAFIVATMIIIKKMMDTASDKLMYQFPDHTPYMLPYGMDYPLHPIGGPEIATSDMYPAALHLGAAAQLQQQHPGHGGHVGHVGHPGLEGLTAESNLHASVAEMQNNTHILAALNAAGLGQKVKREDSWIAKTAAAAAARRPLIYNYMQPHAAPYYPLAQR